MFLKIDFFTWCHVIPGLTIVIISNRAIFGLIVEREICLRLNKGLSGKSGSLDSRITPNANAGSKNTWRSFIMENIAYKSTNRLINLRNDTKNKEVILDYLASDHVLLFKGVDNREDFLRKFGNLGEIFFHRDSGIDGITELKSNGVVNDNAGFSGFSRSELLPHTDRSTSKAPPQIIAMHYQQISEYGGQPFIVYASDVYRYLQLWDVELLVWASSPGVFRYADDTGIFTGPIFSPSHKNRLTVRFRLDGSGYYRYEDTSRINKFLSVLDKFRIDIRIQDGDVIILNNTTTLHGRSSYLGERITNRLLFTTNRKDLNGFDIHSQA